MNLSVYLFILTSLLIAGAEAGDKTQKLKKLFKNNVFTAKDDTGKMEIMSQRAEDEGAKEVTVEAMITLSDYGVSCDFGIIAKKGGSGSSGDKPTGWMECSGEVQPGMLEDLEGVLDELATNAQSECGERYKQCPPNFAYGMLEYMLLTVKKNGKLPKKWKNNIDVSNTLPVERNGLVRRSLLTCNSDPVLGNIASSSYPRTGDANCPQYTTTTAGGNGATCMCPYSGGPKVYSYYDDRNGQGYKWLREYGADSYECAGRCGATCNSADKEAFLDCFDHDSCVDHFGGSVLSGNADCGDEFDEAADDYVVSYGYCCCTCNIWIGCYC